ncbi:MAG: TIGR03546 family protein [Spirochaetales bacterium]|nr:TIGR03546 family protein [Spirochaetales bacterium]MCF7938242.1 TIGR03546 family protein [Spirochaetales bacterium]
MIGFIAKIIAALNANSRPGEIAAGFACGVLLALMPAGNLFWPVLFLLFFLLKLHVGTMILTLIVFKLWIGVADPLIDSLGLWILQQPALESFFIRAANTPVLPLLEFNNALVTGGLVSGLVLWIPLFLLGRYLVRTYRSGVREKIASSKLVRFFEKTPILRKLAIAVRKAGDVYKGLSA